MDCPRAESPTCTARTRQDRRILHWEQTKDRERDERFRRVRQQYFVRSASRPVLETRESEILRRVSAEALSRVAPKGVLLDGHSRELTRIPKQRLREIGWTKATEMAKVARRDGRDFDCATWLHKARSYERYIQKRGRTTPDGHETEPWEIIYFKLYKSQLPVVEQALETAALMLGTDKSRGYSLEMICADFLAGATLETERPEQNYRTSFRR